MAKPKPTVTPVQMPLRVPPELKDRLEQHADQADKSLNQACVDLLDEGLKERET